MKKQKDIYVLGIESSCDETSVAVVKNGREVVSNVISSQIDIHKIYGGVVPEIASRNHVKNIHSVLDESLKQAGMTMDNIDAIAVTYGAGLLGALIVGVSFAKSLAYATGKPLFAVNHIEGHISANYIAHKNLEPPFLCLVVSGGHTALLKVEDYCTKKLVASTHDDAVGEAFDKVARECGLPYPGGPSIQSKAKEGKPTIKFINPAKVGFEGFSYSGLKTAVINYLHNLRQKNQEVNIADVCASFQEEAISQLVNKTIAYAKEKGEKKIVLAGGVSANLLLRERMQEKAKEIGAQVFFPPLNLCTDNAGMIASQGYYDLISNKKPAGLNLSPKSVISLGEVAD